MWGCDERGELAGRGRVEDVGWGRSKWHLRRVQDFAPAAREEGDCDLYDKAGTSQRMLLYFLLCRLS